MKITNISMAKAANGYSISGTVTKDDGREYCARINFDRATLWDDWNSENEDAQLHAQETATYILESEIERLETRGSYPGECFEEI